MRIAMLETGPAGDDGYAEEPAVSAGPARGAGTGRGRAPAAVSSLPEMSGYTRISTDEIAASMPPSPPHNLPEAAGYTRISTDQIAAATLVLGNGGGGGGERGGDVPTPARRSTAWSPVEPTEATQGVARDGVTTSTLRSPPPPPPPFPSTSVAAAI